MAKIKNFVIIILVIVFAAVMFGCSEQEEPKPAAEEKPVAEEKPATEEQPEPEYYSAGVAVPGVGIVSGLLDRGDMVTVTGEQDGFYTVDVDGVLSNIEKRFVRLNTEEQFTEREAVATSEIPVYATAYLEDEIIGRIAEGTAFRVIDEFAGVRFIYSDTVIGYISSDEEFVEGENQPEASTSEQESKTEKKSKKKTEKKSENKSGGNSDKPASESGGGESSTPGSSSQQSSESQDGGDMDISGLSVITPAANYGIVTLAAPDDTVELIIDDGFSEEFVESPEMLIEPQDDSGGMVLSDGTKLYCGVLEEGKQIQVIEFNDSEAVILLDDGVSTGTVPRWAIYMDGDIHSDEYDIYALSGLNGFTSHEGGAEVEIPEGTKLHVIMETEKYIITKSDDGSIIYLPVGEETALYITDMPPVVSDEQQSAGQNDGAGKKSGSSSSKSGSKGSSKSQSSKGESSNTVPATEPEPELEPAPDPIGQTADWTEEKL